MKLEPLGVRKIFCPICKELIVKIYPWAELNIVGEISPCRKCLNDRKLFVRDLDRLGLSSTGPLKSLRPGVH